LGFPAPPWADAEEEDMAATERRGEEEAAAAAGRRRRRDDREKRARGGENDLGAAGVHLDLGKTRFRPGDTPRATLGLPIEVDPRRPTRWVFDPRLGFEYPEGDDTPRGPLGIMYFF
jgi:hypothetical protein